MDQLLALPIDFGLLIVFGLFSGCVEAKIVVHIGLVALTLRFEEKLLGDAHGVFTKLQVVTRLALTVFVLVARDAHALVGHVPLSLQLEEDQSAADLEDGRCEVSFHIKQIDRSLQLDECAELRSVVFHNNLIVFDFEERMGATHTDIGDLHVSFHAAAHLELAVPQIKNVHHLCWSTLDRFEDHVIIFRLVELHNAVHAAAHFILEGLLAQFTLKRLPEVRGDLVTFVDQSLAVKPLFEALNVDLPHGATALAWADQ